MKRVMNKLSLCRAGILFLLGVFYAANTFAEMVYWPVVTSVKLIEKIPAGAPRYAYMSATTKIVPLNIPHDSYVNEALCGGKTNCIWVLVLKTRDGVIHLGTRTEGFGVRGIAGSDFKGNTIHWSDLDKSVMVQSQSGFLAGGNTEGVSVKRASMGCVAAVPGIVVGNLSNVDAYYIPSGLSFDSICMQPPPLNMSCDFTTSDVDFSFGQVGINSSKKMTMTKNVSVNCSGAADLEFIQLTTGGDVLLSNGMTSTLTINNKKPGEKMHFQSGTQTLALTETLSGTPSGFGDFEGHDVLKIAYQ